MNISSYLFGWILATLLGAIFHLWRDGGIGSLLLYLLLSWGGFGLDIRLKGLLSIMNAVLSIWVRNLGTLPSFSWGIGSVELNRI